MHINCFLKFNSIQINYILYLCILKGNISLLKCNSLDFICFTALDNFLSFINENNKILNIGTMQYITDFFFTYHYIEISLHFCFENNTYYFSTIINNQLNLTYWWLIFWTDTNGNIYYFWNCQLYVAIDKNLAIDFILNISLLTVLYFLSAQSEYSSSFFLSHIVATFYEIYAAFFAF